MIDDTIHSPAIPGQVANKNMSTCAREFFVALVFGNKLNWEMPMKY
jgi:hypothetical protein